MTGKKTTGTCLCGEVSYSISGTLGIFQYCHCSRCRKSTGSAFAANLLVSPKDFAWTKSEAKVGRYEPPDARHFATGFCRTCGSSLPWLAQTGRAVAVPAGSLDTDPQIRPSQNIYCASQASWYTEPDSLPVFDEMPPRRPR